MELKDKLALVGSVVSVIALVPPIVGVFKKPTASSPSAVPAQVIHTHGDGTAINTGAGSITQNTHVDRSVHINESVSTNQYIHLYKVGLASLWPNAIRDVAPSATTVAPSTPVSIPKQQIRSPLLPVQGVISSDRHRNTPTTTMSNGVIVEANTIRSPASVADMEVRNARDEPGHFDYYVLSLTWLPDYCGTLANETVCARPHQSGFVLNGLWPSYVNGYPANCSSEHLPGHVQTQYAPLIPYPAIAYEWKKHGTCSGLDPAVYFELATKLKDNVVIPAAFQTPSEPVRITYAELSRAFKEANPALGSDVVLPFCREGGRYLRQVQICFTREGNFMSCSPSFVKRSRLDCGRQSFLVLAVR